MDSTQQIQKMPDGSFQLIQTVVVSSFTIDSLKADIATLQAALADKQALLEKVSGS
jgi:hypothetical protein